MVFAILKPLIIGISISEEVSLHSRCSYKGMTPTWFHCSKTSDQGKSCLLYIHSKVSLVAIEIMHVYYIVFIWSGAVRGAGGAYNNESMTIV